MINVILRVLGIILFVGRYVYWVIKERSTESLLPKTRRPLSLYELFSRYIFLLIQVLIVLQLLGLQLLQVKGNTLVLQLGGVVVLSVGVGICFLARRELNSNWVSGEEYQIKRNQKLIMSGIYAYVRHPIYFGIALSFIGSEMVAGSYLFLAFLPYIISGYIQAKREEKLLLSHFGKHYQEYMQHSKMFVPYVL